MGTTSAVFDVVVVGAGPAGCAAAIQAAQRGLRACLVEARPFPRDRPGETLHPGVEPLLRQLGVIDAVLAAGFPRHAGNTITWGGATRFEPFGEDAAGPWRGFQAWRATFDTLLLERARTLGVSVHQPREALVPLRDEHGRVIGLASTAGEIAARYLIDAAGGSHWLARKLDLPVRKHSRPLRARYGYARGKCAARDEAPAIVADEHGWTWTARVGEGTYQWTRVALREEAEPKDWLPPEYRDLQPQGGARAADVTWRALESPAGAGYFAVGDAAAVLDPASSHGVLKGIMSGMMAAHLIAGAREHADGESRAAVAYNAWLSEWFNRDVAQLRASYAAAGFTDLGPNFT